MADDYWRPPNGEVLIDYNDGTNVGGIYAPIYDGGGQVFNVKHPDFGAVGDGSTDDTAAIQAAIDVAESFVSSSRGGGVVFFPASNTQYVLGSPLVISENNITLMGAGWQASQLVSSADDLVQITPTSSIQGIAFRNLSFRSSSGGGHILNPAAKAVSAMVVEGCFFLQENNGKSVWTSTGSYIDNSVRECWFQHTSAATVPTFALSNGSGAINSNTWQRCRFTYSGDYCIEIDSTSASTWCFDNVIRDITFEVTNGGCVQLLNCMSSVIENANVYDLSGDTTKNLFVLDQSPTAGALESRACVIRNVNRRGGTLGAGLYDIFVGGAVGSPGHLIENCRNAGGDTFEIDLNSKTCTLVNILNTVNITAAGSSPRLGILSLRPPTFTDANRGAAGTAGRVIYNSDDGKLNIDNGTNWTLPDGTTT